MRYALIAGVLVGLLSSYYGVFIVQRGMSFLGNGLAHAAFGGVALGLLLGVEPLYVAAPFALVVALGIAWTREHTDLAGDTAIGIFFAVSMALGIIFLWLREQYSADAFTYLFGSILAVRKSDLVLLGGLLIATLFTLPLWGNWAYATFDRELALADRVPARRDDYLLSGVIAVVVVAAVKIVGMVLVAAFLVIPAAAGRLLARTFFTMTVFSVCIGVVTAAAGLIVSYYSDMPSGPCIVLLQAAIFLIALPFRRS